MGKWTVKLSRTKTEFADLEIEAATEREANMAAGNIETAMNGADSSLELTIHGKKVDLSAIEWELDDEDVEVQEVECVSGCPDPDDEDDEDEDFGDDELDKD